MCCGARLEAAKAYIRLWSVALSVNDMDGGITRRSPGTLPSPPPCCHLLVTSMIHCTVLLLACMVSWSAGMVSVV
jgi:hypothetical protein